MTCCLWPHACSRVRLIPACLGLCVGHPAVQGSLFSSTRGSTDLQIALSWAILGFITLIVMEFLVVVVAVGAAGQARERDGVGQALTTGKGHESRVDW